MYRTRNSSKTADVVVPWTDEQFQQIRVGLHQELVALLDLDTTEPLASFQIRAELEGHIRDLVAKRYPTRGDDERNRLIQALSDEVFGLGPLEPLIADPLVSDILVNRFDEIHVERRGLIEITDLRFADEEHLRRVIQRIVARTGRRIDESNAMVDSRLPDGSRVNAIVPPLAIDGPVLSIRRFGAEPFRIGDLVRSGSVPEPVVRFLAAAIGARVSFLVSGGTGAGKTTFLNALSEYIPPRERLVTIEDSAELRLLHKHVIRLETRNANTEGVGQVSQRDLVRNSLRMRPDRILVGEVRGPEALDMLQAMNTGHEGSLTTIHANDTREALARLEIMVSMAGLELPVVVVRQYIASAIRLVVHLARLPGGKRIVSRVSELLVIENGDYVMKDVFRFEQTGLVEGVAQGYFFATGYLPACLRRLKASGYELPESVFAERHLGYLN